MECEKNIYWGEFVSFASYILLGRLFKTQESLSIEESEQLKRFEITSIYFISMKETYSKFQFHFKECLYLVEIEFESDEIMKICDGNMEVELNESFDILKFRISNTFSTNKLQNLSRYFALKSLCLPSIELYSNAKFLIKFDKYLSLILITHYFSTVFSYDFQLVNEYFNIMIELNTNQVVENDSLFNNCVEKLSWELIKNFSTNWIKASEIMIKLENQQIASLTVHLFPRLFPKMNSMSVINPYSLLKNQFSILNNTTLLENEFLRFHFGFLDIPSFVEDPKILKLFIESAKTPNQIRKMYEVAFPIAFQYESGELNDTQILDVFFGDENKTTSVKFLNLILEDKDYYSLEDVYFNTIIDRYINLECMESLFLCLSEILNPSISLSDYVIQKLQGIVRYHLMIL
jgi:hypothetical protein